MTGNAGLLRENTRLTVANKKLTDDLLKISKEFEQLKKKQQALDFILEKKGMAECFTGKDIKCLITLCHPDKHGDKKLAHVMTQKLNKLRKPLE